MSETADRTILIEEVMQYLPHRYPFLLVDRVVEIVAGSHVRGFKNVTINEPFFNGHFPTQPIFPGVLIVEAMAQLSGVLAFETRGTRPGDGTLYLLGATEKTRFKRPVVPGDRLMMESRVTADRSRIMKFECKAFVDEQLACTSELTVVQQQAGS
ncbi:MAG: 3-hydroxyacyl-ACP dehydratase FabZ [Gammaproteobacteria bacterium]|nr:3-hydroxyacyl-ACP dehydratase FabZ [Gammaproteobacteria bacterium]